MADLCGSLPTTIMECGFTSLVWVGECAADNPTKLRSLQLLVALLFSHVANAYWTRTLPTSSTRRESGDKTFESHSLASFNGSLWAATPLTVP